MNRWNRHFEILLLLGAAALLIIYINRPRSSIQETIVPKGSRPLEGSTVGSEDAVDSASAQTKFQTRTLDRSASNRSKLAVRTGEVGVVRVPVSMMGHLLSRMPQTDNVESSSANIPELIGFLSTDSVVDVLGDNELGTVTISEASKVLSMSEAGWNAEIRVVSEDEATTELDIVMNQGSRVRVHEVVRLSKGHVILCSLGGAGKEGLLIAVGGGQATNKAEAGAGQPAPRSESDSEAGDKPQAESEGRSR